MTRIAIPEKDIGGFLDLFNLNDEDFSKLISTLREVGVDLSPKQIAAFVRNQASLEKKDNIADIVAKLFVSIVVNEKASNELTEGFYASYEQNETNNPIAKESFQARFKQLIEVTNPTKQARKISQIKKGNGLYLVDQNIQMHIKPVFSTENVEFLGNVITHQLQLSVNGQDKEDNNTLFIEVDKNDLLGLKDVLEKSIKQHELLEKKFEEIGIKSLDI